MVPAAILADDPNEVRVLVGFAAVRNYQGRPFAANALLTRALTFDSANTDAIALKDAVRRARAPALELNASWSHDTDNNDVAWQTATQTFLVQDGARVTARVGNQRAVDALRRTSRYLADVSASISPGSMQFTAGAGVRQLNVESDNAPVDSAGNRAEFTWRAIASVRPIPSLGIGLAVEHLPFDEIAALLARGINLTNVEASTDWRIRPGTSLSLSGGTLGFSDGNRRNGGALRLTQNATHGVAVGFLARTFSFERQAPGLYFTPEQFILADPYASWEYASDRWSAGLSAGVGAQRLGPHSPTQTEWHADARTGVQFGNGVAIEAFAGTSTSASASAAAATVGSFRYSTGGLNVRIPF